MNYVDAQTISQSYAFTHMLIKRLTVGLSHADSLVQPPFPGNCLNWVVGHIISGRNEALTYLDAPAVWGDDEIARYKTGSAPITGDDQALPLERLLGDLALSQERLEAALAKITPEAYDRVVDTRFGERPVGKHLDGLHWHETYHLGQLELLRELRQ